MSIQVHHAKGDTSGFLNDFAEPTIIEADQDILAYFLANTEAQKDIPAGIQWNNVLMSNDDDVVTPSDYHLLFAQDIRTFYRNRIMMRRLKGHQPSHFQNKVYQFVTSDKPNQIEVDNQGIMIKLPDFYVYDRAMDHLHENYHTKFESNFKHKYNSLNILVEPVTYTLSFVEHTQKKTKNIKNHEYWFVDSDQILHKLSFDIENPLKHLFVKHLKSSNGVLDIAACRVHASVPGYEDFDYLEMEHWEIQ